MGQFGQPERLLGASGRVGAGRATRAQAHSDLELVLSSLAGRFFLMGPWLGTRLAGSESASFQGAVCAGQSGLIVASPLPLEEKLANEHHEL